MDYRDRPTTIEACVMGDDREREWIVRAYWIAEEVLPADYVETLHDVPCALVGTHDFDLGPGEHELLVYLDPIHGWQSLHLGFVRGVSLLWDEDVPTDARIQAAA